MEKPLFNALFTDLKQAEFNYLDDPISLSSVLFDRISTPMFLLDTKGLIVYCNQSFCDLVKYEKANIVNRFDWGFFVPDIKEKSKLELFEQQRISGKGNPPTVYSFSSKDKEGSLRHFIINIELLGDSMLRLAMIYEQTLFSNVHYGTEIGESKFKQFLFANPDIIFLLNREEKIVEINTNSDNNLLMPRELLLGKKISESHLPKIVVNATIKSLRLVYSTGQMKQFQYSLLINGAKQYFECRMFLSDKDHVAAIIRNVSESKQQETQLIESELRLRSIVNDLPFAVIETNREGVISYVNKEGTRILNGDLEKDNKQKIFDKALELIGISQFKAIINDSSKEKPIIVKRQRKGSVEQFLEIHWTSDVVMMHDQSKYIFVVYDISNKENDRLKLEASENNFKTLVQTSPNGIMIRDFEKVYYTNETAKKILGVNSDEEINFSELLGEKSEKLVRLRLKRTLDGMDMPFLEVKIKKHLSQEFIDIETKPVLINYQGKKVFQIVFRDISYEKQLSKQRIQAEMAENHNKILQEEINNRIQVEDELRHMLEENKSLIQEIHHRVKNNFQIINSLINQSVRKNPEAQAASMLTEAMNRIQSMSLVHECYYQQKEYSSIELIEYFDKIYASLIRSHYNIFAPDCLKYEVKMKTMRVSMNDAIPSGLIFNELISICIKNICDFSNKCCIFVTLKSVNRSGLIISLSKRCDDSKEEIPVEVSAVDLEMVKTLAQQLNGKVGVVGKTGLSSVEFCINT